MADIQGGFATQQDAYSAGVPEITNPDVNAIQPPQIEQQPLQITVKPNPNDKLELQSELQVEADARARQQQPKPDQWSKVSKALADGVSRDDASDYLASTLKISKDDADAALVTTVQNKVKAAKDKGLTDEYISTYLKSKQYDPSLVDSAIRASSINQDYTASEYNPAAEVKDAEIKAGLISNLYSKYSTLGKYALGYVNETPDANGETWSVKAQRDSTQLKSLIVSMLNEHGIKAYKHPETGEVMMTDSKGQEHLVDSHFLRDMKNSTTEIVGGIGGAMIGATQGAEWGAAAGTAIAPGPGTVAGAAVGGVVGAYGGSAVGSAAGRGIDMAINAAQLDETISGRMYLEQMKQAGIFDIVAGAVGHAVVKSGVGLGRAVMKSYKYATAGNYKGAYKALLENTGLTDEQARKIVKDYEDFHGASIAKKEYEKRAITILSTTQQGGEIAVSKAASTDPHLYRSILTNINDRAKSLHNSAVSLTDENVGKLVRDDLNAYQDDVKLFYGQVRDAGVYAIDGTDFRFNLDKLAIAPVLKNIEQSIGDPRMRELYISYATRIENATKDRLFSGLLDLRQAVNEFKYTKKLRHRDEVALNGVLNRIDGQIGQAANSAPHLLNGKQWLENWKNAKLEYAKMMELGDNVLFKALTKEGATEEGIRKVLSRFGNNKDVDVETFNKITERLSGSTLAKVENAAVKNLIEKHTSGSASDFQATHFPDLAEAVNSLNIKTPEAKALVDSINEMAKVFKNDVDLAGVRTGMYANQVNSLGADLMTRAKIMFAQKAWVSFTRFFPGKAGRQIALVHQVSKLLENPLHSKTVEDLLKNMPKDSQAEMRSLVKDLQVQTAKQAAEGLKVDKDWQLFYKQAANGEARTSNGAWGKGTYLFSRIANPTSEMKVIKQEVNLSRMATFKDISAMVGKEVTEKDLTKIPANMRDIIYKQLMDKGYLGISGEGKAMLFSETTLKPPKKGK